jgi:hypothetical protein
LGTRHRIYLFGRPGAGWNEKAHRCDSSVEIHRKPTLTVDLKAVNASVTGTDIAAKNIETNSWSATGQRHSRMSPDFTRKSFPDDLLWTNHRLISPRMTAWLDEVWPNKSYPSVAEKSRRRRRS